MRLKADITLFLISIIWGSAFVAQRVVGQAGSVYIFNGIRYLVAALVVLPFAWRALRAHNETTQSKSLTHISKDQFKWIGIAGGILFVGSAFQQAGVVYTTAGNAGFITSLYVVLIPMFLFLFWGEKSHWLFIVAILLAMVGAFLLSTGGKFTIHFGDLLVIFSAVFWAFHVIILGKYAHNFEPMSFSAGQLAVCGVINLVVGFVVEPIPSFDTNFIFAVAYTAFISLGLCYTLQVWAQRHTPPADAALLLSLESVFAVLSGWLLLDERLLPIQIVGAVLIFVGVVLSQFKEWTSGTIDTDHLVEGR